MASTLRPGTPSFPSAAVLGRAPASQAQPIRPSLAGSRPAGSPLSSRGPSLSASWPPWPPPESVQPHSFASLPAGASQRPPPFKLAKRFAEGPGVGAAAGQVSGTPAAPPAPKPGFPGVPSPRPTAQPPRKLTCGSPEEGCGERRQGPRRRGRPSRRGWAARVLRSCGRAVNGLSLTQPGSAPAAAAAAERFQTCSVSGPARVDATKSEQRRGSQERAAARPRQPEATTLDAGEGGGRRAAKNSSCGSRGSRARRPKPPAARVPAAGSSGRRRGARGRGGALPAL